MMNVISATRRMDKIRNIHKGTAAYLPFYFSSSQSGLQQRELPLPGNECKTTLATTLNSRYTTTVPVQTNVDICWILFSGQ